MSQDIISYIQVGLAVLLIISILLQQRGGGLSGALTGSFLEYSTKRGVEKFVFYSTIVIAVLFFGFSLVRLVI